HSGDTFPAVWWLRNTSFEAYRRSVSGIFATAAAPIADVTPGITSKSIPARASASISSPTRPKSSGSPPFSRTTCLPSRAAAISRVRSEEHTSELQSLRHLVCRLLLEKKKKKKRQQKKKNTTKKVKNKECTII